jgi:hypothetical protein
LDPLLMFSDEGLPWFSSLSETQIIELRHVT